MLSDFQDESGYANLERYKHILYSYRRIDDRRTETHPQCCLIQVKSCFLTICSKHYMANWGLTDDLKSFFSSALVDFWTGTIDDIF